MTNSTDYPQQAWTNTTTTFPLVNGTASVLRVYAPLLPANLLAKLGSLFVMMVVNIIGNSLTLHVTRITPRLWTKNNMILASLTAADLWAGGINILWYIPFNLWRILTGTASCSYSAVLAVTYAIQRVPVYTSLVTTAIVAIDRYVAITYPFVYDTDVTESLVNNDCVASRMCSLRFLVIWSWIMSFVSNIRHSRIDLRTNLSLTHVVVLELHCTFGLDICRPVPCILRYLVSVSISLSKH